MEKKPKKSLRKYAIIGVILLVIIALVWFQMRRSQNNLAQNTETFVIVPSEISLVSIATGKLTSSDEDAIKLTGTVSSLFVELGDVVSEGEVLGEYTKQSLDKLGIYAPIGGIVTQLPSALSQEFIISSPNALEMTVSVPEIEIKKFKLGQAAEVYVLAVDTTFYGTISDISNFSLTQTPATSYTVTVTFDKKDSGALIGMSGVLKTFVEGYGDYYANGKLSSSDQRAVKANGTITSTSVKVGDTVQARQKLGEYQPTSAKANIIASRNGVVSALPTAVKSELVISNPDALQLIVNISETDIHKIELNQSAQIYVEAVDATYTGTVVRIGQIGNTNLDYTTYPVTISFESSDDPLFLGMSGSAQIVIDKKSDILVVPYEAIVIDGTSRYLISSEWLKNTSKPQSDYYIPVTTGLADVYNIEVSGEDLLNREIIIPQESTSLAGLFRRP